MHTRSIASVERSKYPMLTHCFHCLQQIARRIGLDYVSSGASVQGFAHHLRRVVLSDEQNLKLRSLPA